MTRHLGPRSDPARDALDPERRRELREAATVVLVDGLRMLHRTVDPVLTDPDDRAEHQGLQLAWADVLEDRRRVPSETQLRIRRLPSWALLNPRDDAASTPGEAWFNGVMQLVRELGRFALASAYDYLSVHDTLCELESSYGLLLRHVVR